MIDITLLACPTCRARLLASGERALLCGICAREYPVVDGVPILLPSGARNTITHEGELPMRPVYSAWKERLILKALTDNQVALDFGAGRQYFDDPCIIKLDIAFDPTLDVVGDLHALPLAAESIDFAFGGAVMEHIRDPAQAIEELYRVVKPGGYVYADWSFLAAYHGYPDHYTNVTIHGIQQAFRRFTCLEVGVGPHLGPSFALRSILGTYRQYFRPTSRLEREFAYLVEQMLWHPLHEHDARIPETDRFRLAAGVYFFGVKQPSGDESVLPDCVQTPVPLSARHRRPGQPDVLGSNGGESHGPGDSMLL